MLLTDRGKPYRSQYYSFYSVYIKAIAKHDWIYIIIDFVYNTYLMNIRANQIIKFIKNPVNDFDQ